MSRHDSGTPRPHEMIRVSLEEFVDTDGDEKFKIALADGLEPRVPGHHDPKLWQKGTETNFNPSSMTPMATIKVYKDPGTHKDNPGPHSHYYFRIGGTTWEVHC